MKAGDVALAFAQEWVREYLTERWSDRMEVPGLLNATIWRKSQQWWSLSRKHAQVIADETVLEKIFSRLCNAGMDVVQNR